MEDAPSVARDFQARFSMEERLTKSANIRKHYPLHVPVVFVPFRNAPPLTKTKFIFPESFPYGDLVRIVRRYANVEPSEAIFVFCGNELAAGSATTLREVYVAKKDADGFLYARYSKENVFGDATSY